MNNIADRILNNWKTTAAGLLSVAGVVFGVLGSNYSGAKWVLVGSGIVAGLTGLLAKDK